MKNVAYLFIFSLFIFQNATAQPSILWEKEFGGSKFDWNADFIRTNDGNWLFVGVSTSPDGDVPGHFGANTWDPWVFKTDTTGTIIWSKNFGGSGQEEGGTIFENSDGSFWMVGETHSFDGLFTANKGKWDIYVLKISASGDPLLNKTFGGTGADDFSGALTTADGGLIFLGSTWSSSGSGDVIFNHGERDCWLVKLNSEAEIEWQKSIGGSKHESESSLLKSKNGGYWLVTSSQSSDGDFPMLDGAEDTWVLRLDDFANIIWKQRIGLPSEITSFNATEDTNGNLAVVEFTGNNAMTLEIFTPDRSLHSKNNLDHIFLPGSYWQGFRTTDAGGFYFFGVNASDAGFLTKTNDRLEIIWQHIFQNDGVIIPRQVVSLEDHSLLVIGAAADSSIFFNFEQDVQIWVTKMEDRSTRLDEIDKSDFQIFPNPIAEGESLKISFKNDFVGEAKIEILSLDGRVLQVFEIEKTTEGQIFEIENLPDVNLFFVRLSDGKKSITKPVTRFSK